MSKYDSILSNINNSITRKDTILIIDGHNTFMRAMSSQNYVNDNGIHIGGISGFLLSIGSCIKALKPINDIIIVFDGKNTTFDRKELYKEYKANRKTDTPRFGFQTVHKENNAIKFQMTRLFEYLTSLPVKVIISNNVEADDIIGHIVSNYKNYLTNVEKIFIMSNDKDFLQNIVKNDDIEVSVYEPHQKIIIDKSTFTEKYKIIPENYTVMKSIIGDTGDNIDGVKGIGIPTFLKLFPFIVNSDIIFNIETFFEIVKGDERYYKSKSKNIQNLLLHEEDIKIFYKLVDLRNNTLNNISTVIKNNIINVLQTPKNITNKFKVLQLAMQDGTISYLKDPISWVEQVFIF